MSDASGMGKADKFSVVAIAGLHSKKHQKRYHVLHIASGRLSQGGFKHRRDAAEHMRHLRKLSRLHGSGFISRFFGGVKAFFGSRNRYPKDIQDRIVNPAGALGSEHIVKLQGWRAPVDGFAAKVANAVSLGRLETFRKQAGYENFFHVGLIVTLMSGMMLRVEKLHVISAKQIQQPPKGEVMDIKTWQGDAGPTLRELLERGRSEMGDSKFFSYDPTTNNCQSFLKGLLKGASQLSEAANNFFVQDITGLERRPRV